VGASQPAAGATSLDSPSQLLPIGRQHCLAEFGRCASRPRGRSGSPTASTRSRSPRAALGHPDVPLAVEDPEAREIKLIVDHRETLVRQRTEAQDRLRWLLHAVDPEVSVSAGALDRKVWLDRVERRLARAQCIEVRVATGPRGPLSRADRRRQRARARDRGTRRTVRAPAPRPDGLWNAHRRKLIGETGGIGRVRTDAQRARLAGVAPLDASSGRQQRHRHGNRQLTPRCTNWPSSKAAGTRAPAPPSNAARPKARHDSTRCAASSDCWPARLPPPAPDTGNPSRTRRQGPRRKGPSACACLSCRWSLRSRPADAPERARHSAGRTQGPPQQQVGRRRQFSITASYSLPRDRLVGSARSRRRRAPPAVGRLWRRISADRPRFVNALCGVSLVLLVLIAIAHQHHSPRLDAWLAVAGAVLLPVGGLLASRNHGGRR
jgi:hypothetical protein